MRSLLVGLFLLGVPQAGQAEVAGGCSDLLPPPATAKVSAARALVAEDLVRLRDIGPSDASGTDAALVTRSPDGGRVAFQIRRADPIRNNYCQAMVVLPLRGDRTPILIDQGGEFLRVSFDNRGKANFPTGIARPITPRWSANGRWIAFLKKVGGRVQVWRAEADGSGSHPLTASMADVEDFRLGADGRTLLYTTRPALQDAYQAIAKEGATGFHYDDRFNPSEGRHPFPLAPVTRVVTALDLSTGALRAATPAEAAILPIAPIWEVAWTEAQGPRGRKAWLGVEKDAIHAERGRLQASDEKGQVLSCAAAACADGYRPWWTNRGHVRFLRREGWANESTAVYDWLPGPRAPRRLYITDDVLADCAPDGDALMCLREGSLSPRKLEKLEPESGRRDLLFDPNPEFASLSLGAVQRLHLRNGFNLPSIADLVLPVGYHAGTRYPLVVVQYDTRGFLRGGTGDAFPIQAFANAGYAVLSVSTPQFAPNYTKMSDVEAIERTFLAAFGNRRSELSAIEVGVQRAIDRGIADPKRIGLTGMSDGATVSDYAVLHSKMFAAFATTNCCFDETFLTRVGPIAARFFTATGYPKLTDRSDTADKFWDQISLVRNAATIHRPILVQVADDELLSALPTFTALREVGAPIDMFVMPDEYHVKWQPIHRLAMYERSLDWFNFWLKHELPTDPTRLVDVRRWATFNPPTAQN